MIEQLSALFESQQPLFILIAGPNGAGKSTFRRSYLNVADLPCVDPDEIAREIFGGDPQTKEEALLATVEASKRVEAQFHTRTSFALESVFSDTKGIKLNLLRKSKRFGYRCGVIFIGLDDPQLSMARVMDRVDNGGHDVPDELIRERFPRAFQNLKRAISIADFVVLVDNSSETRHRVFGCISDDGGIVIWDSPPRWYKDFEIGD